MVLQFNKAIVTRHDAINHVHDAMCVEIKKVVAKAHNEIKQVDCLFFSHL
jgi:hypothetical protein